MNFTLLTDSYKVSHSQMYPKGTEIVYSYFESREGAKWDKTVFFGLQSIIKKYLVGEVFTAKDITDGQKIIEAHLGPVAATEYFRKWARLLQKHGGYLPVRIKAVAEGTVVDVSNILMSVENTDPEFPWLTNHLETLLTHVWYPSTVATKSWAVKQIIKKYLNETCDSGEKFPGINFMLHDFGMRGVSSMEAAGIGGLGHLVNFLGTDTLAAIEEAIKYYGAHPEEVAFSVPATEHSVMTSLGRDGECEIIGKLLDTYPTGILSIVSDSYDIYNCISEYYGKVWKDKILARDGKLVVRPDSGDPIETTVQCLRLLDQAFGSTVNKKGYKILHPKIGLLWGDGIDIEGIEAILVAMAKEGWSAENIVFGMGGGLLQKLNRDTQRFAFKCSAQKRNGEWFNVYKEPRDTTKTSKRGKLTLIKDNGKFKTVTDFTGGVYLNTVFENGVMVKDWTLKEIREAVDKE